MAVITQNAFKSFYYRLVKVLPINNMSSTLYSHDLLPGDHKDAIDALDTQKKKVEYFLDRVIKPGVEIGYTGQFDEMLKVMENSDDPPVKFLAGEIKKFISEEKSSLLNVSHHGHFGNLPSLLAEGIYLLIIPALMFQKTAPKLLNAVYPVGVTTYWCYFS